MENVKELSVMKARQKAKVCSLTRDMFEDKYILDRYFKYHNKHISRFHIPELTDIEYQTEILEYACNKVYKKSFDKQFEYIANIYRSCNEEVSVDMILGIILNNIIKSGKISKDNLYYTTASDYYLKKMRQEKVKRDLSKFYKQVDFTDYIWNDNFYEFDSFYQSMDYADNAFRENSDSIYDITARQNYITECYTQKALDYELFYELYSFCVTAIKHRKVMLYSRVEKCISTLRNIIENTDGLSINTSKNTMAVLQSYQKFFTELLTNEETAEWLANNSDISVYAVWDETHSDYTSTYVNCIRNLTAINSEAPETEAFVRGLIHNEDDIYEEEIIRQLYTEPTIQSFYEEDKYDDED